jgi:hypothetical protein
MALDQFTEMLRRMADIERRINNVVRPCRVVSVDAEKGTCRVSYALDPDGKDVQTIEIPWMEHAGEYRTWRPPSVGQNMYLVSPGGEIGVAHSYAIPGTYGDTYKQPHNKEGEYVEAVIPKKKANPEPGEDNSQPANQWHYNKITASGGFETFTPKNRIHNANYVLTAKTGTKTGSVNSSVETDSTGLSEA